MAPTWAGPGLLLFQVNLQNRTCLKGPPFEFFSALCDFFLKENKFFQKFQFFFQKVLRFLSLRCSADFGRSLHVFYAVLFLVGTFVGKRRL